MKQEIVLTPELVEGLEILKDQRLTANTSFQASKIVYEYLVKKQFISEGLFTEAEIIVIFTPCTDLKETLIFSTNASLNSIIRKKCYFLAPVEKPRSIWDWFRKDK